MGQSSVIVLAYVGRSAPGVVSRPGAAAIFGELRSTGCHQRKPRAGRLLFVRLRARGGDVPAALLFADSSTASLVIGILGVVIFTGLTAWDVQRLKSGAMPNINKDSATVLGALALYLDFINLFLFMLRIFGSGR
jgi:FtsH-binding integral membrane protein